MKFCEQNANDFSLNAEGMKYLNKKLNKGRLFWLEMDKDFFERQRNKYKEIIVIESKE